jgi:hypothetical protein
MCCIYICCIVDLNLFFYSWFDFSISNVPDDDKNDNVYLYELQTRVKSIAYLERHK